MKALTLILFITLFTFVLSQGHSHPHPQACNSFSNCNDCASQDGCVWCNNRNSCLSNANLGTTANQCYNDGGQSLVFTALGCSSCT